MGGILLALSVLLLTGPALAWDPGSAPSHNDSSHCPLVVARECRVAGCVPGSPVPEGCSFRSFTCDFSVCWDDPHYQVGTEGLFRAVSSPASFAPGSGIGVNHIATVCMSPVLAESDLYLESGRFILDIPSVRGGSVSDRVRAAQACAEAAIAGEEDRVSRAIAAMDAQAPGHPLTARERQRVEDRTNRILANRTSGAVLRVSGCPDHPRLAAAADLQEARTLLMTTDYLPACRAVGPGRPWPPDCDCLPRVSTLRRVRASASGGGRARRGAGADGGGKAPITAAEPAWAERKAAITQMSEAELEALLARRGAAERRGDRVWVDGVRPYCSEDDPSARQEALRQLQDEEMAAVSALLNRIRNRVVERAIGEAPAPEGYGYQYDDCTGEAGMVPLMRPNPP